MRAFPLAFLLALPLRPVAPCLLLAPGLAASRHRRAVAGAPEQGNTHLCPVWSAGQPIYVSTVYWGGKDAYENLGAFETPEHAALAVARRLQINLQTDGGTRGGDTPATGALVPPSGHSSTAFSTALRAAEARGIALLTRPEALALKVQSRAPLQLEEVGATLADARFRITPRRFWLREVSSSSGGDGGGDGDGGGGGNSGNSGGYHGGGGGDIGKVLKAETVDSKRLTAPLHGILSGGALRLAPWVPDVAALPRVRLKLRAPETSTATLRPPACSPPPLPPRWPAGEQAPEETRVEGLLFLSVPFGAPTLEPSPRPTAAACGEAATATAAEQHSLIEQARLPAPTTPTPSHASVSLAERLATEEEEEASEVSVEGMVLDGGMDEDAGSGPDNGDEVVSLPQQCVGWVGWHLHLLESPPTAPPGGLAGGLATSDELLPHELPRPRTGGSELQRPASATRMLSLLSSGALARPRSPRLSVSPLPPAIPEPGEMPAPNRGAVAKADEQRRGAAPAAAAPAQRAKRLLDQASAHAVAQLGAVPQRRSRREKPTCAVGRRVRATFEVGRKPSWFFGVVLAAVDNGGSFLVGFDDGKQEHMRADQLTICGDVMDDDRW